MGILIVRVLDLKSEMLLLLRLHHSLLLEPVWVLTLKQHLEFTETQVCEDGAHT